MISTLFQTNQLKKFNMRHERSSKKESYSQFAIIYYIFLLYGIDLNIFNKSRMKCVLLWFIKKFIVLFHIYSCAVMAISLYQSYYQSVKSENLKRMVARACLLLSAIFLWHIINRRRRDLSYLFIFVEKQKIDFQIANAFYINMFSVLWPILSYIITYRYNTPTNLMDIYFFYFIDSSACNCHFLYYAIAFVWIALCKTFASCVVILHVVICNHFQKVILKYRNTNLELRSFKSNSNEAVTSRLCIYESIIQNIKKSESIMTFPIFITFIFSVIEAFYGMLMLFNEFNEETGLKKFAYTTRGFISICLITYAASRVNDADQKAKVSNDDLLRNAFTVSSLSDLDMKLNLRHENEKPALTLTAWNFFEFKRSFVLAAVGCVLTYALLFINLEK